MSEITPGDLIRSSWLDDEPTPAPEGEAVAWMDRDVAWDVISDVHKKRWSEINGPASLERYSRPLYASPVVPVGVSERMDEVKSWVEDAECSRGCSSWRPDVHGRSRCDCGRGDALEATDAILAALRPTDTGREG